jgi:ABC-2 type transport system ATP-binding protein
MAAMRRRDCSARAAQLCERLGVDPRAHIGEMSKGNRQKVGVVQAFMHDPDLLVMDEPTSGLDPVVQKEFDDLLQESTARGAAVLLSSHVMSEVERLASRVAIVNRGSMVAFDRVEALRDRTAATVVLEFAARVDPAPLLSVPGFSLVRIDGPAVEGTVRGSQNELLRVAVRLGVIAVRSPERTLDELFLDIVHGNIQ